MNTKLNAQLIDKLQFLSRPENLHSIRGIKRGIERETLRFQANGTLSQADHPKVFGSALTHPFITTDYAESLLEFITPADEDSEQTIRQLTDIHSYVCKNLGDEFLWPLSMPCYIADEQSIRLAEYGSSNVGKMKHRYRQGLHYRYGSLMQAISGVHFNFSFSDNFWQAMAEQAGLASASQDFKSAQYLHLIRNFKRRVWLLSYIYGASPALCTSFVGKNSDYYPFEKLGKGTFYLPNATSLRMSDLGYTNDAQASLNISYSTLDEYVAGLRQAIQTPAAKYALDKNNRDGHQQLNSNILQIENEFYSPIRPKRITHNNEKPTDALAQRGIEYIEVRSLDVNPFSPVGIEIGQMHFLDVFLTYCLLTDSPLLTDQENQTMEANLNAVIINGRQQGLVLQEGDNQRTLQQWGGDIFADLERVAEYMDKSYQTSRYSEIIQTNKAMLADPSKTLSARFLNELLETNTDNGRWALRQAQINKTQLAAHNNDLYSDAFMAEQTALSLQKQLEIEQNDKVDFDTYLANYFAV